MAGVSRRNGSGFVYFMRSGDRDFVKVGWALDPEARLRVLQCGNPDPLELLASLPGSVIDEQAWHQRLRAHSVRDEWFRLTPEVFDMISRRDQIAAEIWNERQPVSTGDETFDRWRDLLQAGRLAAVAQGAYKSVLSERQVREIKADRRSVRAVAAAFGVSKTTVQDIRTGRTWRHVT